MGIWTETENGLFVLSLDQHGLALRQNKYKPELIDCDKLKPEVEEEADRGDCSPPFSPFLDIFLKEILFRLNLRSCCETSESQGQRCRLGKLRECQR